MVVFGVLQVRCLGLRVDHVFFIAQNPALLASPPIPLEHCLPGAGRIKRHAKHLASLAERGCQRRRRSCLPNTAASPLAWPMFAPSVVPVALWAAILALVFPRIVGAVLHSELTAALRVLAHKWWRVAALFTAVTPSLSDLIRHRLKRLRASRIRTHERDPLAAGQVHAVGRAKLLCMPGRKEQRAALETRPPRQRLLFGHP